MSKYKKLSHVVYSCDYHILWVPKYRLRILKGDIKDFVINDIKMLCEWKGCEVEELNVKEDHFPYNQHLNPHPKPSVPSCVGSKLVLPNGCVRTPKL